MSIQKTVLVVSPTPSLAQHLQDSIRRCGYTPVIVRNFAEGKAQLDARPQLLVTEMKLGAFNGLHLALRGAPMIPAIVIADSTFEHEVAQLGATWMSPTGAGSAEVDDVLERVMQDSPMSDACSWYENGPLAMHAVSAAPLHSSRIH